MAAYRWMFRTIGPNLRIYWYNMRDGISNCRKFFRAVWNFSSSDYTGLLGLMTVALTEMRDLHRYHGHTVSAPKMDKQLTIALSLCKRLREDDYFTNAGHNPDTWRSLPDYTQTHIAKHSHKVAKNDAEYLGKLFRFVQHWWD